MSQSQPLTRKDLLRSLFRAPPPRQEQVKPSLITIDLPGTDFPPEMLDPEMLTAEAKRQGLDPHAMDRDTLLRTLFERMAEQHQPSETPPAPVG